MARNDREIEKEIRRIEGQLLVAKQICRENLKEINHLKKHQETDLILRETNRLLACQSLDSNESVDQFNRLLRLVDEQQRQQTNIFDNTIQIDKQESKNEQSNSLLVALSSNVAKLESLLDYAKDLFTQPITSINNLDNTISLQDIADEHSYDTLEEENSIELTDLEKRIDTMHKRLAQIHHCDDCLINKNHFFLSSNNKARSI